MASRVAGIRLSFDATELMGDVLRVHKGKLKLPTVSAIKVKVEADGETREEEVPVWLER